MKKMILMAFVSFLGTTAFSQADKTVKSTDKKPVENQTVKPVAVRSDDRPIVADVNSTSAMPVIAVNDVTARQTDIVPPKTVTASVKAQPVTAPKNKQTSKTIKKAD